MIFQKSKLTSFKLKGKKDIFGFGKNKENFRLYIQNEVYNRKFIAVSDKLPVI